MIRSKKKRILLLYLIFIIPSVIILLLLNIYSLNVHLEDVRNDLIDNNEMTASNTASSINSTMEDVICDLKVIRDSNEVDVYINDENEISKEELSQLFVRFAINKPEYMQIRYIDKEGKEQIRVDNDGAIKVVADSDLQNKSDRYYFTESKNLEFDETYISPLDLNEENGEVEIPYVPVIRVVTPISETDENSGFLVFNYNASKFVDLLKEHIDHEDIDEAAFYVVNGKGEFIVHNDPSKDFSFMIEEYEDLNFQDINSEAWAEIQNNDSGTFESGNELITYSNLLKNVNEGNLTYSEKWIEIHVMNIGVINSKLTIMKEVFSGRNLIIFIILNLLSFVLAWFTNKIRSKDSQLEITQKIASSTSDGIVITDSSTNIIYANKSYEEITGYSEKEVLGKQPRDFKSGKQDDIFYKKMWKSINEEGFWEGMLWDKKKNGVLYLQKMKVISVKDRYNKVHHYVSVLSDISLEKNDDDVITSIDNKSSDYLIPNENMMLLLLKQSVEDETFDFMVIYISIENLNNLISEFPEFEKTSTDQFVRLLREVIDKEDYIAQTARNTFAVVVGINGEVRKSGEYVNQIHKSLSKIIEFEDKKLFFKTKMGISYWPYDTNEIKKLLLNASIALEWSKNRKIGDVAFFNEQMLEDFNMENEIELALREALNNREFYMVYQPQVEIETNKVVGVEALIRWENKKLGNVPPSVFIPIAENNNSIIDIGYWITEQVCKDLKKLNAYYGKKRNKVKCAINLSAIQMQQKDFLSILFSIFDIYGIDCKQIEMELTENIILQNREENITILNSLRESGMTIAIDDFGTGYSSFSYLKTLPIDKIKIDRSFIKDYPEDDGKLAKILVMMAESLEKEVLTEGAETAEQVKYLQDIGCKYIQGYFYSKPLRLEDLMFFLDR